MWIQVAFVCLFSAQAPRTLPEQGSIPTNRVWDVLQVASGAIEHRPLFVEAGEKLGDWSFYIDAMRVDGKRLKKVARKKTKDPFLRVVRENFGRPVDLDDFLYFVDDLLLAGQNGLRGNLVWIPASRARKAGIFIHPDDVFLDDKPRLYGQDMGPLNIDKPKRQIRLKPANDGSILGPRWCARYK